ncbi:unnamed protein product [Adineta steineri]|uniref:F-box domain-containing protein n=2 Tax=Adineta steineri TaxID=433720 RepID=A0A819J4U9_9BILA|nr:unnamed protein product [Adineta steineri]
MSNRDIESTTWFDHFPTEIIFHIFDYLSTNDIIYTFFDFNQRLNTLLLQNQSYFKYFELPTTNINFWKTILSIIGSKIECLYISTINLRFSLSYFSNLKSIIISSSHGFPNEELNAIIDSEQFNNLHSFKIKQEKIFLDITYYDFPLNQNDLLNKVFNNKNLLKIFQSSLLLLPFSIIPIDGITHNFNLHSLTLVLFNFGDVFKLIENTPNLRYLNFQSKPPYTSEQPINTINLKLKQFHWTLIHTGPAIIGYEYTGTDFDQLTSAIKIFSSSLICLSLNLINLSIRTTERFPFNSIKLRQLLESMIKLKQFHLYARLYKEPIDIENVLSQFKTRYWFDKNLSFGMHGTYFYTLPFYFDDLYEFSIGFDNVKTNNYDILINNHRIWHNVKSIQLCGTGNNYYLSLIETLKIQMPKLSTISFGSYFKYLRNETERHHLNSVTTFHFAYSHIEMEMDLLMNILPNLNHLILSEPKSEFTKILNSKIQKLYINNYSEMEKLAEINYVYFCNVKYININLFNNLDKSQLYANIIMKILKNCKSLDTLLLYTLHLVRYDTFSSSETQLSKVIEYLDIDEILNNYRMKYFQNYLIFSKEIVDL